MRATPFHPASKTSGVLVNYSDAYTMGRLARQVTLIPVKASHQLNEIKNWKETETGQLEIGVSI